MLSDLGMWSEVIGCCDLSSCSKGVLGNKYCLLQVFLMLRFRNVFSHCILNL